MSDFWDIRKLRLGFTIVVYEIIILEALINNQYMCHKNNTGHLCLILGTANIHWIFSSTPKDGSDNERFSNRKWAMTMCYIGNLRISEASLIKLKIFHEDLNSKLLSIPVLSIKSPVRKLNIFLP